MAETAPARATAPSEQAQPLTKNRPKSAGESGWQAPTAIISGRTDAFDPGFGPRNIAWLNARAGNHAVAKLMLQRQPRRGGTHPAAPTGAPAGQEQGLADQLFGPIPNVPPISAITSTTEAQTTTREMSRASVRQWQRNHVPLLTTIANMAATNRVEPGAPRPSAAGLGTTTYAARTGLVLACSHYDRGTQLEDVAQFAGPRGPLRPALAAELNPLQVVMNPTGAQMRTSLFDAIVAASALRPPGGLVELVVWFVGHGSFGEMVGSDHGRIAYAELLHWQTIARSAGVHLELVADTCNAGQAEVVAEFDHNHELITAISALPEPARSRLTATRRRILRVSDSRSHLGFYIGLLHEFEEGWSHEKLPVIGEQFRAGFEAAAELVAAASEADPLFAGIGDLFDRLANLAEVLQAGVAHPARARATRARYLAAPLLDRITDITEVALSRLDDEVTRAGGAIGAVGDRPASPGGGAGGGGG